MANNDLLKEAIADAKAVKETAIANAKLALEEAFTPHLKSMLSAKLDKDFNYVSREITLKPGDSETQRGNFTIEVASIDVANSIKDMGVNIGFEEY